MENFTYWLGQAFGILALICCFVMPLFKKKWQMLVLTALGNLFFALNYISIGEIRAGMVLNVVAIVQVAITFIHLKAGNDVTVFENMVFLLLNVLLVIVLLLLQESKTDFLALLTPGELPLWDRLQGLGILVVAAFKNKPLELIPPIAAVFNTLATFQRDEQKTRVLTLINAGTYFTYYAVLGMSSMFAELLAAITCVIGMIRYRRKS